MIEGRDDEKGKQAAMSPGMNVIKHYGINVNCTPLEPILEADPREEVEMYVVRTKNHRHHPKRLIQHKHTNRIPSNRTNTPEAELKTWLLQCKDRIGV